jgi:hypothetical protein
LSLVHTFSQTNFHLFFIFLFGPLPVRRFPIGIRNSVGCGVFPAAANLQLNMCRRFSANLVNTCTNANIFKITINFTLQKTTTIFTANYPGCPWGTAKSPHQYHSAEIWRASSSHSAASSSWYWLPLA